MDDPIRSAFQIVSDRRGSSRRGGEGLEFGDYELDVARSASGRSSPASFSRGNVAPNEFPVLDTPGRMLARVRAQWATWAPLTPRPPRTLPRGAVGW